MFFRAILVSLAILFAVLAPRGFADEPWTVRGHVPRESFVVQAHRGAGELAEENTIEAFRLGWKLNCVPEADVRMTKDGVLVAFHDASFARVVREADPQLAKRGVRDVTFAELEKLDVGSWKGDAFAGRKTPRLRDVFAEMKGQPARRLYLDVKEADLARLAAEVREFGVEKQTILASTKYDFVREWKKLVPESATLLWMGGTEAELEKRFEELRETEFADVDQLQIHVRLAKPVEEIRRDSVDPFKESDAFLVARGNELREEGVLYQTLPYGGSSPEVYSKLLDLGFMSFATDHPEATWTAIDDYYRDDRE